MSGAPVGMVGVDDAWLASEGGDKVVAGDGEVGYAADLDVEGGAGEVIVVGG